MGDTSSMDINTMQEMVAAFVAQHDLEVDPAHRLLDVVSEVGELSKEMLRGASYGGRPFAPPAEWEVEMGDVFFALIRLANNTGVDLARALEKAVSKYEARLAEDGRIGSRE